MNESKQIEYHIHSLLHLLQKRENSSVNQSQIQYLKEILALEEKKKETTSTLAIRIESIPFDLHWGC